MSEGKSLKIGTRVEVIGKGVVGTVAFVGTTLFSSGSHIFHMLAIAVLVKGVIA